MNFIEFKKKFIELYNQQKFEKFDKKCVDFMLGLNIDEVTAPTFYEAVCLAAQDTANVRFLTKAELDTFLGEIFKIDELRIALDTNEPILTELPSANLSNLAMTEEATVYADNLNSSQLTDNLAPNELKFTLRVDKNAPMNSSATTQIPAIDLTSYFKVTKADLTFFSNWANVEAEEQKFKIINNTPNFNSSVYYTLGDAERISAKLYDVAAMRSITEYYISYYDNNDTYISDVADETLFEFMYDEK